MKLVDCYRLLGLRDGASYSAVKTAYRKLARRYHPDANPGDQAANDKFVQIAQAYKQLIEEIESSQPKPSTNADSGSTDHSQPMEGLWMVPNAVDAVAAQALNQTRPLTETDRRLKQDIYGKLQTLLQSKRYPRAVALVEGLAQRLPQDAEVRQWQAITYQHWARQLSQIDQADKARVYLKKALRVVPDNRTLTQELSAELERLEQRR